MNRRQNKLTLGCITNVKNVSKNVGVLGLCLQSNILHLYLC